MLKGPPEYIKRKGQSKPKEIEDAEKQDLSRRNHYREKVRKQVRLWSLY